MENLYYFIAFLLPIMLLIKFVSHGRHKYRLPPSPFAYPIIGHLRLFNCPFHLALNALSSKYGPIFFLRLGFRRLVVISSPSAVEECFVKNDVVFANRPRTTAADHISYNYTSLAWAPYGHLWRVLRRISVVELLSSNKLLHFSSFREEEVRYLLRQLFKVSNDGTQKVDLRLYLSLLTVNLTMRMIAGKQCVGEETGEIETQRQNLHRIKKIFVGIGSMTECDFLPILRWVGYKGIEKRVIELANKRDEYLQGLLDEFRRNSSGSDPRGKERTLLGTLLSLQQSDPDFYSDDVIKGMAMTMISAGTDTTSVTIEWAMSLLLNHPEALEKARSEIDGHVKPGDGRLLDDSDLDRLPYLRRVVNETLRLYPALPILIPHLSSEDCNVCGYDIPRGSIVMVNLWAMHRDPNLWKDATEFKPERFEEMDAEREREGFKFVPFGAGRRACPGAALGMKTILLALGALIQCFEWEKVEAGKVDMNTVFGITMHKAKPLEIIFRPRPIMASLLSQL